MSVYSLWLPIEHVRVAWSCVLALATYLFATMSRDLSYFDSPELAMVAVEAGLSHPPGQVLHTLIGGLAVHILPVSPLLVLNGLSVVCGALCLLPAFAIADLSFGSRGSEPPIAPVWYACLTLALCHAALWEQATRVEVYALATLLALWTLVRGLACSVSDARSGLVLGFAAGLTASANPVFAILTTLALAPSLLLRGARWRFIGGSATGAVLGLLPYAYLSVATQRAHAFVWGDLSTSAGLWHYLSGADFQRNLSVTPAQWGLHALDLLLRENGRWFLPILLFGAASACSSRAHWEQRLPLVLCPLLAIAYMARNAVWNPDIPDYVSYLAPSLHAGAAAGIALSARIWERQMHAVSALMVATLCGTSLLAPPSVINRTRAQDRSARVMATEMLRTMPQGALAILSSDHIAWPALYLQRVEGLRRDVVILPRGLASSSWFWSSLYREHPELMPFAMRGPGGAPARVRRFVDAQAPRAVVAESMQQLLEIGMPGCLGPWFVSAERHCIARAGEIERATATLAAQFDLNATTDPSSEGALSAVAYSLSESALRLGHPEAALRYLLAALPPQERPLGAQVSREALSRLPAWSGASVQWQRAVPLGDPARNAWVASQLAAAAGNPTLARRWLTLALDTDLPEAAAQHAPRGPR